MIHPIERKLNIKLATSFADYMFTRKLRNEVRVNMTEFTGEITFLQQVVFWMHKPNNIQLYVASIKSERVAYLLLRFSSKRCFITEVVDRAHRNMGIGSSLIDFAKTKSIMLTAEILKTNTSSLYLHEKNGFEHVKTDGSKEIYEYSSL